MPETLISVYDIVFFIREYFLGIIEEQEVCGVHFESRVLCSSLYLFFGYKHL